MWERALNSYVAALRSDLLAVGIRELSNSCEIHFRYPTARHCLLVLGFLSALLLTSA